MMSDNDWCWMISDNDWWWAMSDNDWWMDDWWMIDSGWLMLIMIDGD